MKRLSTVCLLAVFHLSHSPVRACTLWAAAGDEWVKGGGTLIVKNRDWRPDHQQEVRLTTPKSGFRYFGLYALGKTSSGIKAGINEHGLVVVTATAGAIPEKERVKMKGAGGVTSRLLSGCDSVESALQKKELFVGPQYIMLADRKHIAYVEIGDKGRHAIRCVDKGILYHTNHYLEPSMLEWNRAIGESSRIRCERIKELLEGTPRPYTLNDFAAMSKDQHAGPDNSIHRTGSSEKVSATLACWIVALPPEGSPRLWLRILNPGKPERLIEADVDDIFAGKRQDLFVKEK